MVSASVVCAEQALPRELWGEVLSNLVGADLGRALCACRTFASVSSQCWQIACYKRWPQRAELAAEPGALWRRQYELLSLRDLSERNTIDVQAICNIQPTITERHRMILAEWLCEVAMDWNLENTLVFKAMSYLDYYMTLQPVQMLSKFQLLGLACLRAAMGDARKPTALVSETDKALDAQRFAHVSDDTYTVEEVEQVTQLISGLVPDRLKTAPNMKMFLRSFWYRASLTGVLCAEEMHVYTLASFFLQLSLLDLSCCAFSASLLAAASLCQALVFFGREGWSLPLQRFGSYRPEELEECRARLRDLAARVECPELRRLWLASHEHHGYDEYREDWKRLLGVLRAPADVSGGSEEAMEQD